MSSHGKQREQPPEPSRSEAKTSQTVRNTLSPDIPATHREQLLIQQLESVVNDFRCEQKTKISAITQIFEIVNQSGADEGHRRDAVSSYLILLDTIKEKEKERGKRAEHRKRVGRTQSTSEQPVKSH